MFLKNNIYLFYMKAFCVKCHKQREIKNEKEITTKNGRHAKTGVCPVCGTKMYRFVKK